MPTCCIRGCGARKNNNQPQLTLHPFPKNEISKRKWLDVIGIANINPLQKDWYVCSLHFHESCFSKSQPVRLLHGAVPLRSLMPIQHHDQPSSYIIQPLQGLKAIADENNIKSQLFKICRLCLNIKCNLFSITKYKLEDVFENLTGLTMNLENGLPYMLCVICAYKLQKYDLFRRSCIKTNNIMIDLLENSENVSILESIEHTNYKNELQISTKIDSFDLIITEFDDKQTNIDDNTEQDNLNFCDENLISIFKNEDLDTEDVIAENILTVEYDNSDAENDNENNSTVENSYNIKHQFDSNLTVEYDNSDAENDNENNSTVEDNSDINHQFDSNDSLLQQIQEPKKAVEESKVIEKNKEIKHEIDKPKRANYKPNREAQEEILTVQILTIEEQIAEIENRKLSSNYIKAAFKCEICFKGFLDPSAYNTHMFRHSNDCGEHECNVCKIRFKQFNAVRKHKMSAHIHKFSCKKCVFVTTHTETARLHEKWHKGTKYSCPHCTEVFNKSTSYMSHVRIKHPSDFVCELCGYSFISAKGKIQHKNIKHRGENQVVPPDGPYCEPCNVRFATDEAYRKHLSISLRHDDEDNKDKKHKKEPIKKIPVKRKKVRNERVTERKEIKMMKCEEPIPCEQCGLELKDSKAYHIHFRKMHPDKNRTKYPAIRSPLMCELCGRIFQNIALLKDHHWIHTGERPLKCEHCDKTFQSRQCLAIHKEVHAPASHACDLCGKLFKHYCNMKRHMRYVHSDLKPFKCELCDKNFKSLPEKKEHISYVHMKKPWPKRNRNRRKAEPVSQTESESL